MDKVSLSTLTVTSTKELIRMVSVVVLVYANLD